MAYDITIDQDSPFARTSVDGRQRVTSQASIGDYKQIVDDAFGIYYDVETNANGAATFEDDGDGSTLLSVTPFSAAAAATATIDFLEYI